MWNFTLVRHMDVAASSVQNLLSFQTNGTRDPQSADVRTRIEPELKKSAETVLLKTG